MECIPLVMEPQSRIYSSPVIVLDFQSLYPSIIIAYNLCYCTMLGRLRLDGAGGHLRSQLGVIAGGYTPPLGVLSECYTGGIGASTAIRRKQRGSLETLSDADRPSRPTSLFISSNGVVFAPHAVRAGVLPRMLKVNSLIISVDYIYISMTCIFASLVGDIRHSRDGKKCCRTTGRC